MLDSRKVESVKEGKRDGKQKRTKKRERERWKEVAEKQVLPSGNAVQNSRIGVKPDQSVRKGQWSSCHIYTHAQSFEDSWGVRAQGEGMGKDGKGRG
jgi:hypothetical protein